MACYSSGSVNIFKRSDMSELVSVDIVKTEGTSTSMKTGSDIVVIERNVPPLNDHDEWMKPYSTIS